MKYESAILKRLTDTYGVIGNPRYISEIIKEFIVRGKECFPNLFTYQADWLAHIDEFGLSPSYTVSYTGQSIYAPNTLEKQVKSAILKGNTGYRDIDTGEFLETFEEGRNLELVSVKMPVLTTSNEDGTKTNILTVNEPIELRGIGEARDELDLMTGEVVQSVGEIVLDGSDDEEWRLSWGESESYIGFQLTANIPNVKGYSPNQVSNLLPCTDYTALSGKDYEWFVVSHMNTFNLKIAKNKLISSNVDGLKRYLSINPLIAQYQLAEKTIKTVDLTILDQNGQNIKQLMSFNGGTHFITGSLEGSPLPSVSVSVETDLEETLKVCSIEGNTM